MEDNKLIQEITQSDMELMSGPLYRAVNELTEYLHKNGNRTLQQEYDLIVNKKSGLSKRLRDLVVMLVETETSTQEENDTEKTV